MATKKEPIYSDLDLNMMAHPMSGDLVPKTDINAVRQAIRSLFFLDAYDIPFDGFKHSSLKKMLFEPASQLTESRIRTHLTWLINKVEPRVKIDKLEVDASSDGQGYQITVWYSVRSIMANDKYQFSVDRIR